MNRTAGTMPGPTGSAGTTTGTAAALRGRVVKVVFSDDAKNFHIARIRCDDGTTVSACGPLRGIASSDDLSATGRWETHPKYGRQFRVDHLDAAAPATEQGLVAVIARLVDGVGEGGAYRLVRACGGPERTIAFLDGTDARTLPPIPRLSDAQIDRLCHAWRTRSEERAIEAALAAHGVTPAVRGKILAAYGSDALRIVQQTPHRLALDLEGVGFLTADAIALAVGVPRGSVERCAAAIVHAIGEESEVRGHTWTGGATLKERLFALCDYQFSGETWERAVGLLVKEERVIVSPRGNFSVPALLDAERRIAAAVSARRIRSVDPDMLDAVQVAARIHGALEHGHTLSDEQRAAVDSAIDRDFTIITGGPGVGKTTVTKAIAAAWTAAKFQFALVAPTGRAAKRLSEATGCEATTIHRLLGRLRDKFEFDEGNPLELHKLCMDEASMADCKLMDLLFRALPPDCAIVLVGDPDQLPPVGPGAPFRDLIDRCPESVRRLSTVYRQAQGSRIVMGSREILAGQTPAMSPAGCRDPGTLFFAAQENDEKLAELVVDLVAEIVPAQFGIPPHAVQVISPQRTTVVGVEALNGQLRDRLNPRQEGIESATLVVGKREFRVGDRVMQTKNDYTKGVVNGDLGVIVRTIPKNEYKDHRPEGIVVQFDSGEVRYLGDETNPLDLAYASTVHKCVHPDTLIETVHGLMPIRRAHRLRGGFLATPRGIRRYENFVENPDADLLEIITKDGYRLTVTPDHGIDAWDAERGFVRTDARDLKSGAILRLKLGMTCDAREPAPLPNAPTPDVRAKRHRFPAWINEEVAEFMGLMVADGTLWKRGFRLVKRHKDVADRFALLCVSLFGAEPHAVKIANAYGYEINSSEIAAWLQTIGGMNPNAKRVPECILRSPIEYQAAFLRGLFEDGTVNVKNGRVDHVLFTTVYPPLQNAVRTMLLRFGIITGATVNKPYNVYLYGVQCQKFRERIGFVSEFKNNRLRTGSHGDETHYAIPLTATESNQMHKDLVRFKVINRSTAGNLSHYKIITRHTAQTILRKIDELGLRARLLNHRKLLIERLGFHYSKIRDIQPTVGPSMCVTVPDGHQFLQNGFAGWNCQGAQFPAIVVVASAAHTYMLDRTLIYTAITRAQQVCIVAGSGRAFGRGIQNARAHDRRTLLPGFLEGAP